MGCKITYRFFKIRTIQRFRDAIRNAINLMDKANNEQQSSAKEIGEIFSNTKPRRLNMKK